MSGVDSKSERVQKIIANAGFASRREAERLIESGQVSVNGKLVGLGAKATLNDKIRINGQLLKTQKRTRIHHQTIGLHKPIGTVCTRNDPQGRPTVFELLPKLHKGRWIQVGRLDINTSGLILFTTDGELAHRLMHPSYEIEREYAVRVRGKPTQANLNKLLNGVQLEDGPARFLRIENKRSKKLMTQSDKTNHWFHVVLKEGRKREVRRLWEAVGYPVNRLIRVRYADIRMHKEVQPGHLMDIENAQLKNLRHAVKL